MELSNQNWYNSSGAFPGFPTQERTIGSGTSAITIPAFNTPMERDIWMNAHPQITSVSVAPPKEPKKGLKLSDLDPTKIKKLSDLDPTNKGGAFGNVLDKAKQDLAKIDPTDKSSAANMLRKKIEDKAKKDLANFDLTNPNSKLNKALASIDPSTKEGREKAIHIMNKVNLAIMRVAILGILDLNLLGLAKGLSHMITAKNQSHWKDLKHKWWLLGGEEAGIEKAINKGKDKKQPFQEILSKMNKKKGFDGSYSNVEGDKPDAGKAEPKENVGKSIAVATSALGVVTPVLAAFTYTAPVAVWTGAAAGGLGAMGGIIKSFAKENGATDADLANVPDKDLPEPTIPPTDPAMAQALIDAENNIAGVPKPYFWGGIAIVGLGLAFLTYKIITKKHA